MALKPFWMHDLCFQSFWIEHTVLFVHSKYFLGNLLGKSVAVWK